MNIAFVAFLLSSCIRENSAVPSLQQTVPPGGVAVCPLSTVQYTCVADIDMRWEESGSAVTATYTTALPVNDTAMAGVFDTVLTDISGNTLTSTATIDSVSLGDDGRNITCHEDTGSANQQIRTVQVANVPLAPTIGGILSSTGSKLIVNLTWSNSRCVVVYYVEVTATNTNFTNMTTSQYITLSLQIGVVHSFRVRGADSINRLGEWSDSFVYRYTLIATTTPSPTVPTPTATPPPTTTISGQLGGGAIAGIVIGMVVLVVIVILVVGIIKLVYYFKKYRGGPKRMTALKKPKAADKMTFAELELSGETKGSGKSRTTSKGVNKPPVDTTRVSYTEVEHSGTHNKGVKKPAVDIAYEPVDHNKTSAPSMKATQSAPSRSPPNTKPPRSKPGQNQSVSVK